jgi:hypothetical protein
LEERICEGAGHLAAATGAWLALVEEFDRRAGWAVHGLRSCAHWLSWKCGFSLVTGREHVRVARALVELPRTRAELAAGRLSYSKVRALTRVATPASEAGLVETALHCTGAQLDQLTAGIRKAGSLGQVNARHAARSLSWSWAEDGSLLVRGRFSPEDGAVILAALAAARDSLGPDPEAPDVTAPGNASAEAPARGNASSEARRNGDASAGAPAGKHASAEGPGKNASAEAPATGNASAEASATGAGAPSAAQERRDQRVAGRMNADAMVVLAETMLARGAAAAPGGERHQVVIHASLETLLDDAAAAKDPARIEDGPELHPETLRRLCCDSAAVIVAHHQENSATDRSTEGRLGRRRGTWMDVGRRTRVVPVALRRALMLRDGGCRFPGCTERRFVDAHHVVYWSWGGPTAYWNLIMLCRRHHRSVHEGGYRVSADGLGGFTFHRPDGSRIPETPSATGGRAEELPQMHRTPITAETTVPDWNGERLDLDYAVSVLTQAPRHASAEAWTPTPPSNPELN